MSFRKLNIKFIKKYPFIIRSCSLNTILNKPYRIGSSANNKIEYKSLITFLMIKVFVD